MNFDPLRFCTPVPAEEVTRDRRISELAYYRAEQRGFAPGGESEDWAWAEAQIDKQSVSDR